MNTGTLTDNFAAEECCQASLELRPLPWLSRLFLLSFTIPYHLRIRSQKSLWLKKSLTEQGELDMEESLRVAEGYH